jgi:hypothetical protein
LNDYLAHGTRHPIGWQFTGVIGDFLFWCIQLTAGWWVVLPSSGKKLKSWNYSSPYFTEKFTGNLPKISLPCWVLLLVHYICLCTLIFMGQV